MVQRTHRLMAFGLAVALLGALSAAPVVAQPPDEVTVAAGINADTVDGKHAVSARTKKKARANKLVATSQQGLLPSNILKPLWSLMVGIPAVFADGQVTWTEIVGLPAVLADGQVAWGEIAGIPAGFADGVDDGVFESTVVQSDSLLPWEASVTWTIGPFSPSADVDFYVIPTDGGFGQVLGELLYVERYSSGVMYRYRVSNNNGMSVSFKIRARVHAVGVTPAAPKRQLDDVKAKVVKVKRRK